MIEKVKVRRKLALYENHIKEEIKKIENEIKNMENACITEDMKVIWHTSTKYYMLQTKLATLSEVLFDIVDIRCDEMFEDNK